ncbi:MAG: GMC family oxidoreductase [Rhodoferax sp.]
MATHDTVDIAIVGAGACGAAAAWRLSRGGRFSVACLEQGDWASPAHYPSTRPDWELSRAGAFNVSPNVRGLSADYPIDDSGSPIAIANYNGVGGSTVLYSAHFPRFHPSDFQTRTLDGVGDDWPLRYADLLPYFHENERMMGVAGLVGDPANPDYESLLPPVPLGPMGQRLAAGFNQLGWHWWPSPAAIATRTHQGRAACINLGPCNTGCAQGAKGSVDVTYWPAALRQGVRLMPRCRVLEVTLDKRGRASGLRYRNAQGQEAQLHARVVVLAANGIGTPRLLLHSRSAAFPDGLLNTHGEVGRRLMLHPLGYVEAVFDEDLQSSLGPHGCCLLSQEFYESDAQRGFVRGYTLQALRGAPAVETALSGYFMRRLPLGAGHHAAFRRLFNHTAGLAVIAEDLPETCNRIELDPTKADSDGMPGVKVHYRLSDNTRAMLKHGLERAREVLTTAGGKVSAQFAPVRHTGWHLMGTVRMGDDPRQSLVNRHGQAHEVDNLYVVDSSLFVTGGAVNPVATAQALALYVAEHIAQRGGSS